MYQTSVRKLISNKMLYVYNTILNHLSHSFIHLFILIPTQETLFPAYYASDTGETGANQRVWLSEFKRFMNWHPAEEN